MSKYTTGEIAKICEVTVRTVQYYDSRGILTPSELSDGGRRLYTDDDLKKLKIICFLRDMGLPINSISKMLSDSESKATVEVLLQQHEQEVKAEYEQCSKKLDAVRGLLSELKQTEDFTVNTLGDVAQIMKNKDKRKKVMRNIILSALGLEACEILTGVLWGITGIWWPFAVVTVVTLITVSFFLLPYYYKKISYICPCCHEVFKPKFWEMFWANHTPKTRKLTCPHCNKKCWCVETYDESSDE